MRTRRANYPCPKEQEGVTLSRQKRRLFSPHLSSYMNDLNRFDALPEDILISIMLALSASATSPVDLVNAKLACKRFCSAASNPKVLKCASARSITVKASKWTEESHKFLKLCAGAGNLEAIYMLGMIRFYCLMSRASGVALMAEAAMASHPVALYSLAVIQFNGSGGSRKDKVLRDGVVLCAKAAAMGHIDSMRELGHCLQDGYGVKKNVLEGRKFLLEANAREASATFASASLNQTCKSCSHDSNPSAFTDSESARVSHAIRSSKCLCGWSAVDGDDIQCHSINTFLVEWFALHPPGGGLRLCSYKRCGRPETRRHEFRRCSACGCVNYCSRACQALDWKVRHRYHCSPFENWDDRQGLDIVDPEGADEDEEEDEGGRQ